MKSTIRLIIVLSVWILSTILVTAQSSQTGYFTDSNLYRHTMNPAMGNETNYFSVPAMGSSNFSFRGNLALRDIFYQVNGRTATFLHPNLTSYEVLKNIKENNRFGFNADVQIFSIGFDKFDGYNTVSVNLRGNAHLRVPGELFRLVKEEITNKTYDINNINAHAHAYMEIALGHSRQISEELRLGATMKILLAGSNIDAQLNKAQLTLNEDKWTITSDAEVKASSKGFVYKTTINEDTNNSYVDGANMDGIGINGGGLAVDLGAVYQLDDTWSFSASIIDLGFINWRNNMVASTNGLKTFTTDEYIFSLDDDQDNNVDDELDRFKNGLSSLYELEDMGNSGSTLNGIGTTINLGASYILPSYQQLKFGLLNTNHIQKNFSWSDLRASANWTYSDYLSTSLSVAYGTYGGSMGWMVNFHPKKFNIYLAMDAFTGKLTKQYIPLSGAGSFHVGLNIPF